jgi:hypothetical protein
VTYPFAIALLLALFPGHPAQEAGPMVERPKVGADAPLVPVTLVSGRDFALSQPDRPPVAWWKVLAGSPRVEQTPLGTRLVLRQGDIVQRPLAAWAGAADAVEVAIGLGGVVSVTPSDGLGGSAGDVPLEGALGGTAEFRFRMGDLAQGLGRAVVPRFAVQLRCDGLEGHVDWFEATAALPCPSEPRLRSELVELLTWSFGAFLERALDDVGPRATSFVVHDFDADSGERIGAPARRATYHPLYGQLLDAWRVEPRPEWEQALVRFASDLLELGLHPESGLPRYYDPVDDRPLDDQPIEIRVHLEFLLDLAQWGPEALRARALGAARKIGETVLASGLLPDGSVCPRYLPATGAAEPGTVPIRRLDVPAGLARLGALTGDPRYLRAARDAVEELAFDHYWPGSWDRVDPGFDDNYGHYGERAVEMWEAYPNQSSFRLLALSGYERYDPMWRDALRFGGNVAADQVRCWHIAARIAELEPDLAERVAERLEQAVLVHFTGEQVSGGHWIDVTVVGHDPQRLPVGDTGGVPQNLLEGLALCHDPALDLDRQAVRARFTAVLSTTLEVFGGRYGLIGTAQRATGEGATNSSVGSLRVHAGVVEMLSHLAAD